MQRRQNPQPNGNDHHEDTKDTKVHEEVSMFSLRDFVLLDSLWLLFRWLAAKPAQESKALYHQ